MFPKSKTEAVSMAAKKKMVPLGKGTGEEWMIPASKSDPTFHCMMAVFDAIPEEANTASLFAVYSQLILSLLESYGLGLEGNQFFSEIQEMYPTRDNTFAAVEASIPSLLEVLSRYVLTVRFNALLHLTEDLLRGFEPALLPKYIAVRERLVERVHSKWASFLLEAGLFKEA
jgi:hypothetical protein